MNKSVQIEIAILFAVMILSFYILGHYDLLEKIVEWSRKYEQYEIDEIFSTSIVLVFGLLIFSVRRLRDSIRGTNDLQDTLNEIKTLRGIIPICSYCKKIRDDAGAWNQLEAYIQSHSDAEFSHWICPECYKKQLEELDGLPPK